MEPTDLIQKYLENDLSEEEKRSFDQRLAEDTEFVEELKIATVINADFNLKQKERWKAMREEVQIIPLNGQQKGRNWLRPLLIAASILFIGLTAFWFLNNESLDNMVDSQLAAGHTAPMTMRGENRQLNTAWENVRVAFVEEDFALVIDLITALKPEQRPESVETDFYLGLAYLYENQYDQAIGSLRKVLSQSSDYEEETQWFLALAYLKNNQSAEARKLLQHISENDQWKAAEAKALLNRLVL